jgi:DMSO reductase anchor subunit
MARHGLLIVLTTFLFLYGDVGAQKSWLAGRSEAFVLAALALALLGSSGHLAAS